MGYMIKKEKNSARSLGNMEEKKRGEKDVGKQRIGEKTARDKRAIKSSFIHTVSSNYQCIYSIP